MEHLALARIDDRLIHGQVMTAWAKVTLAKRIIIVDNKVAADDFMAEVIKMAAPSGMRVDVYSEDQAVKALTSSKLTEETILLAKVPNTYKALIDRGVDIKSVNVGGMGMNANRKTLYKNIAVTEEERAILKEFIEKGIEVFIQVIPSEKAVNAKTIIK